MDEIITLLISWHLAKKFNKDENEAIKNTAKQLNKDIKNKTIKDIVDVLVLESTSATRRIETMKTLETVLLNAK